MRKMLVIVTCLMAEAVRGMGPIPFMMSLTTCIKVLKELWRCKLFLVLDVSEGIDPYLILAQP